MTREQSARLPSAERRRHPLPLTESTIIEHKLDDDSDRSLLDSPHPRRLLRSRLQLAGL